MRINMINLRYLFFNGKKKIYMTWKMQHYLNKKISFLLFIFLKIIFEIYFYFLNFWNKTNTGIFDKNGYEIKVGDKVDMFFENFTDWSHSSKELYSLKNHTIHTKCVYSGYKINFYRGFLNDELSFLISPKFYLFDGYRYWNFHENVEIIY